MCLHSSTVSLSSCGKSRSEAVDKIDEESEEYDARRVEEDIKMIDTIFDYPEVT